MPDAAIAAIRTSTACTWDCCSPLRGGSLAAHAAVVPFVIVLGEAAFVLRWWRSQRRTEGGSGV